MNLLTTLLLSGNKDSQCLPAFLPPPRQLALISTLVVHPNLTTRAHSKDKLEASNLALRYLWSMLKLLGPSKIPLIEAFEFHGFGNSSLRGGRRRRKTTGDPHDMHKVGSHNINSELANTGALWNQVEDFWQIVGWAFNCSVMHKSRWERWGLWLDLMTTLLEDEVAIWESSHERARTGPSQMPPEDSLLGHYLTTDTVQNGRDRKILNSIFADGRTARFTSAFPEVWKDEVKLRKSTNALGTGVNVDEKIDIEADQYRDYMIDSESDLEDAAISPSAPAELGEIDTPASLGGPHAFDLRLRLLVLLSKVCWLFPNLIMSLSDFYGQIVEHIRPLPLPLFSAFLSSSSLKNFHQDAASTLLQGLLRSFIESSAPTSNRDAISQDQLEKLYLPYAANTNLVFDNAKMGICIEAFLRLLASLKMLKWSPSLDKSIKDGIAAREKKCLKGKSRPGPEKKWLLASAGRMKTCVILLKQQDDLRK